MLREVRIITLTPLMLKQIKGLHGQIYCSCSICNREFTQDDTGKTIVSFVAPDSKRRKKIAKSHVARREYAHKDCFNSLVKKHKK